MSNVFEGKVLAIEINHYMGGRIQSWMEGSRTLAAGRIAGMLRHDYR
jgi:hypothetical protein